MALNGYVLNGPAIVIQTDSRDPYVSWQHHLIRAGRGGVDLVAVVDTPVYAPTAGVWRWLPDNYSAGNSGQFGHDANPGWSDVFSHLSRYVGWSGKHFEQGEVIAYTGNTGGVDQHLHRHLLDPEGERQNPWLYFSGASLSATYQTPVVVTTIAPQPLKEQDMIYLIQRVADGDPVLNGMECAAGPGYFQSLGAGDLAGIARDLHIPADRIVRGQDGAGLPSIEFTRLMSLFQIPPGYVEAGGSYLAS